MRSRRNRGERSGSFGIKLSEPQKYKNKAAAAASVTARLTRGVFSGKVRTRRHDGRSSESLVRLKAGIPPFIQSLSSSQPRTGRRQQYFWSGPMGIPDIGKVFICIWPMWLPLLFICIML